jgi:hypothetical protein
VQAESRSRAKTSGSRPWPGASRRVRWRRWRISRPGTAISRQARVQRHPADQQPPQRSDPPGADREGDARVVRSAGQLPAKYPASARIATRPEARARSGIAARGRRSRSGAVARRLRQSLASNTG